jgi:hypothetical protein
MWLRHSYSAAGYTSKYILIIALNSKFLRFPVEDLKPFQGKRFRWNIEARETFPFDRTHTV